MTWVVVLITALVSVNILMFAVSMHNMMDDTISETELDLDKKDMEPIGRAHCNQLNFEYINVEMINIKDWQVVCVSRSPFKIYRFDIP